MKRVIPFRESLERSIEATQALPIESLLKRYFPDVTEVRLTEEWEDRLGTDAVGSRWNGRVKVDLKLLSIDPHQFGKDVIPIELYSVKETGKKGYEGDSDYILWIFVDTLRTVLVRRDKLVSFVESRREEWEIFLEQREQLTELESGYVYTSVHCNVPGRLVDSIAEEDAVA